MLYAPLSNDYDIKGAHNLHDLLEYTDDWFLKKLSMRKSDDRAVFDPGLNHTDVQHSTADII
jgi:hypothetical protein